MIIMKKVYENNSEYLYEIELIPKSYIKIKPKEKIIIFYDNNFNVSKELSFNLNKPIGEIPNIPERLYGPILTTILKAIRNNDFPDQLNYASH